MFLKGFSAQMDKLTKACLVRLKICSVNRKRSECFLDDVSFICSQFGKQTVFMSEVEQSNPELFRNVLAIFFDFIFCDEQLDNFQQKE